MRAPGGPWSNISTIENRSPLSVASLTLYQLSARITIAKSATKQAG